MISQRKRNEAPGNKDGASAPARLLALFALAVAAIPAARAATPLPGRVLMADSIKVVAAGAPVAQPRIVRAQLTAAELSQPMSLAVSLRMPNFDELEARLQAGEQIPQAEMEARYLPIASDFARVSAWLVSQGLKLTLPDTNHTNVFASGSVAQVAAAFGVSFSRVATADGEFSSAVTTPSLPADLAPVVLGIGGLQPHILMHVPKQPRLSNVTVNNVNTDYYAVAPFNILAAYNVPGTLTGAGQTIAIIMAAAPSTTDLAQFWLDVGVTRGAATYTLINVSGGPTGPYQASDAFGEVTLDVQWSSGIASQASLRMYAIPTLSYTDLLAGCTMVRTDGIAKVASFSAGGAEAGASMASFMSESQEFAQMAAAGITMFASSGDGGSNPDYVDNGYTSTQPISAEYPASDPNVAGVGGTSPTFNSNSVSWPVTSEVVWDDITNSGAPIPPATNDGNATGGAVSDIYPKPTWQTGGSLLASESNRCVPDVAAMSTAFVTIGSTTYGTSAYVYQLAQGGPGPSGAGGTSLASPMWAGLAAILNQARANASLPTVGLLGPVVYPLLGTNAFTDITSGTNGAYNALTGYDLCTGLGSPNIANIIAHIIPSGPVGNTATGTQVLAADTTGANDTGTGYESLFYNTTGSFNTATGIASLYANTTGGSNTATGVQALFSNTGGSFNTATGIASLYSNTGGSELTATGYAALLFNTSGAYNSADGYASLYSNTTGGENTATGAQALYTNTMGSFNTATGYSSLLANTTANDNTASGFSALKSNTTGGDNTAYGFQALRRNTAGSDNTAVGSQALSSDAAATDTDNTAVGFQALFANNGGATDTLNTAVGYEALHANTTGYYDTALGYQALHSNASPSYSLADGAQALLNDTSGTANVALGYQALGNITTGGSNLALGQGAGSSVGTGGSYNIDIDDPGTGSDSSTIRIGNSQVSAFIAGIAGATASGGVAVYVDPATGQLGTVTSSQRFKADIQDMGSASEAVLSLRPVTFRYRQELDPKGTAQFGLVAEEVEKVSPGLVLHDAGGRVYTVRYEAVNAMLLNEFRKDHERVQEQARIIAAADLRAKEEQDQIASHGHQIEALLASQGNAATRQRALDALTARLDALETASSKK